MQKLIKPNKIANIGYVERKKESEWGREQKGKQKDETGNHIMQQTSVKWVQKLGWQGRKSDPLEIVQEIKTWQYMICAQTRISPRKWKA